MPNPFTWTILRRMYIWAGFRYIAVDNRYLNMYDGIDASKIESDICAHWVKNWPTILESGLKK